MQLLYSVVIPLLNEQEAIPELYARLKAEMEKLTAGEQGQGVEIIFVDDGSTDNTARLLREIIDVDHRVVAIRFRKQYGKTSALDAGFRRARGRYTITLDGDLQHRPEDIPLFVEKLKEGYDIVCGWRARRVDNLWMRRIPSRIANKAMKKLSGVDIDDFGGGFKAYKTEILKELSIYGGMQRFIPALATGRGATVCQVPIENIPRRYGSSRYGISRVIPVFFDLMRINFLLKYLQQPLRFFGGIGIAMLLVGTFGSLWMMVERLVLHHNVAAEHGPFLLMGAVLIITGIQMLMIGLIGEMISWFHNQNGEAREYAIAEVLESSDNETADDEISR